MTWEQYQDKINRDFFSKPDVDAELNTFYCNAGNVSYPSPNAYEPEYVISIYRYELPDWVLKFR